MDKLSKRLATLNQTIPSDPFECDIITDLDPKRAANEIGNICFSYLSKPNN